MDIQNVSIALAGIGIFIAAVNSIISSRKADQQRQTEIETRQAELFMHLYHRWSSPAFRKSMIKVWRDKHVSWTDFDDFMLAS